MAFGAPFVANATNVTVAVNAAPTSGAVPGSSATGLGPISPSVAAAAAALETSPCAPSCAPVAPSATHGGVAAAALLPQAGQRAWLVPLGPWVPSAVGDAPDGSGRVHEITSTDVMLGRKETCHIQFASPTVSGEQCKIQLIPIATADPGTGLGAVHGAGGGAWQLEDRSSNGTFVNGGKVGRGMAVRLQDGDVVKLTRNAGAALQFRFCLSPPPSLQGQAGPAMTPQKQPQPSRPQQQPATPLRSPAAPPVPVVGATSAMGPLAQGPRLQAPEPGRTYMAVAAGCTAAAAIQRGTPAPKPPEASAPSRELLQGDELCKLKEVLRASAAQVEALTKEREQLKEALASGAVRADGLRTAEEEAVQEAERVRLAAQRSVLEGELSERQRFRDHCRAEVERAKIAKQTAAVDKQRLAQELDEMVKAVYRSKGDKEAYDIVMDEHRQESMDLVAELQVTQQLSHGLEASLTSSHQDIRRLRAEETTYAQRCQKRRAALEDLQTKAKSLAADMRMHADSLCELVGDSRTPRSQSKRLTRSRRVGPLRMEGGAVNLQAHVELNLEETLAAPQHGARPEHKENVAPPRARGPLADAAAGATQARSKRRRLWGKSGSVPSSQRRSFGQSAGMTATKAATTGVVPLSLEEDSSFAITAPPVKEACVARAWRRPPALQPAHRPRSPAGGQATRAVAVAAGGNALGSGGGTAIIIDDMRVTD